MLNNDFEPAKKATLPRIRSIKFFFPGKPISLESIDQPSATRIRLDQTGQKFTFQSHTNSTQMAIAAAQDVITATKIDPNRIGLIISAPSLITSYGLEIPAIAIRAALKSYKSDCLNVAQGCAGFLVAMRLAAQFLQAEPERGDVLIVTSCQASTLMKNFTHGAFSWGDAAVAILITSEPGPGLHFTAYREENASTNWGAMRLQYGDAMAFDLCNPESDLTLEVDFEDSHAFSEYLQGEQQRCFLLIENLLSAGKLSASEINAVFLPSIGRRRIPHLLAKHPSLIDKVQTDFSYPHMGGVDIMLFLDNHIRQHPPIADSWYMAMTPAFTALWGGVLFRFICE